jgi:hypothetical protein
MYKVNLYEKIHIENNKSFKDELINSIENSYHKCIKNDYELISKTDWGVHDKVWEKEWSQIFFHYAYPSIENFYMELGYRSFSVDSIWFQEYETGSSHSWHTHPSATFSNIYYLNYPQDSPPTQFLVKGKKIDAEVQEGDLILFPGSVIHRSPENTSSQKRLVVVFNSYAEYR